MHLFTVGFTGFYHHQGLQVGDIIVKQLPPDLVGLVFAIGRRVGNDPHVQASTGQHKAFTGNRQESPQHITAHPRLDDGIDRVGNEQERISQGGLILHTVFVGGAWPHKELEATGLTTFGNILQNQAALDFGNCNRI